MFKILFFQSKTTHFNVGDVAKIKEQSHEKFADDELAFYEVGDTFKHELFKKVKGLDVPLFRVVLVG